MASKLVVSGMTATCVYDDRLRPLLEALGAMHIRRATEVEFDEQTQEWTAIHIETGLEIGRGKNRAEVIAAEVAWLERRLK